MNPPPQETPRNDESVFSLGKMIQSVARTVFMYWALRQVMGLFKSSPQQPSSPQGSTTTPGLANYQPIWHLGDSCSLHVFVSEKEMWEPNQVNLIWKESDLEFGNPASNRKKEMTWTPSAAVQNNGSLYAHIFLSRIPIDSETESDKKFHPNSEMLYYRKILTRYLPKKKEKQKKKLFSEAENETPLPETEEIDSKEPRPIISYWWPNITIQVVGSHDPFPVKSPPLVLRQLRLNTEGTHYYPILIVNDFWLLQENLMPINDTVKSLNMSLTYDSIPMWKHQLYTQFEESFRIQNSMMGVASHETDEIKRMLLETNPILLAITFAVSLLHSIFDFLAFKNDIDFWKNRKNMEGLSFRALVMNIFFQSVIFLYLLDNDTSWMILISSGVGLLIEIWKINKSVKIRQKSAFPYVEFLDRVKPSKLTSKTRKYDQMAFGYLSYLLFPLLAGYTIYSLLYEEHKGWYSFIIGTLVGFVYTFGFISMTPQLFINYKLKSVAHMPWKTFMYKALNTFIDDLFAFVIKMPTLHRIACLRDDVVFLIYLYQKWIYPEDKRRRNEFGQVGEHEDEEEEEQDGDDDDEVKTKENTKKTSESLKETSKKSMDKSPQPSKEQLPDSQLRERKVGKSSSEKQDIPKK